MCECKCSNGSQTGKDASVKSEPPKVDPLTRADLTRDGYYFWTAARFENEFRGVRFKGVGWYNTRGNRSVLVQETSLITDPDSNTNMVNKDKAVAVYLVTIYKDANTREGMKVVADLPQYTTVFT